MDISSNQGAVLPYPVYGNYGSSTPVIVAGAGLLACYDSASNSTMMNLNIDVNKEYNIGNEDVIIFQRPGYSNSDFRGISADQLMLYVTSHGRFYDTISSYILSEITPLKLQIESLQLELQKKSDWFEILKQSIKDFELK